MNYKLIFYKYRFFLGYIAIGVFSLILEFLVYNSFNNFQDNYFLSSFFSVIAGVLFSFWLNVRYNFKISKSKRDKALAYFVIISLTSYIIQIFIIENFVSDFSYESLRVLTSSSLFWIAYIFHRKFSFKDYKKVGIAIYANGVENLDLIFKKVSNYPDFIHVDIVDKTININAKTVLSYKTEVIRAFWNTKFIEAHIMSKEPKVWISKIINHVDRIFVHCNIDENIEETLKFIKQNKCEAGIVVQELKHLDVFKKYNHLIDSILVLCIKNAGYSGQNFEMNSLDLISHINNSNYRNKISLVVDGGVNNNTISLLKAENVVSGSFVLDSKDPIRNIQILQTSSQYESI